MTSRQAFKFVRKYFAKFLELYKASNINKSYTTFQKSKIIPT